MAILTSPLQVLTSTPPVTRGWTAATIVASALYAWLRWNGTVSEPYLTLVPGSSIFYPWTFLTSALVETSIFEFIATIIFVPPSLRYLERLWGSVETLKFIAATIVSSNIIAFAFNWIEFMATQKADIFLYGMEYHGQMALQIGLLVAFTQLIPEHQVQVMGFIKARVKVLPMGYLTISTVMTILGFQCPWIIIQFGWFTSWIYLRFYKKNPGDTLGGETYGDRSETFSLVSWFPPFAHYPIGLLGTGVYSVANRLHLIPTVHGDVESGIYAQVPGSARAEAERRRAMALKALDQRMANSTASPSTVSSPQVATPRPESSKIPTPDAVKLERSKSVGEADVTDTPKGRIA
ncbi:hypothetical protein HGRIS_008220 [Hohenbuehelia grisea]|uniref:Eukaryotic integral membrane protein n=1 Tax=Hohenbuehelia grisea TaxID=104357 RepID=A0ABR3J864_9AGAR